MAGGGHRVTLLHPYNWHNLIARVYELSEIKDDVETSPRPWATDDRLTFYAWRTAIEEVLASAFEGTDGAYYAVIRAEKSACPAPGVRIISFPNLDAEFEAARQSFIEMLEARAKE